MRYARFPSIVAVLVLSTAANALDWHPGPGYRAAKLAVPAGGKTGFTLLDPATELGKLVKQASEYDVVFPALHGRGGEDGSLAGLFELLGLPYVGSRAAPSAIAFGKNLTKLVYRHAGLPVAR